VADLINDLPARSMYLMTPAMLHLGLITTQ
jgi:hypothetical protein